MNGFSKPFKISCCIAGGIIIFSVGYLFGAATNTGDTIRFEQKYSDLKREYDQYVEATTTTKPTEKAAANSHNDTEVTTATVATHRDGIEKVSTANINNLSGVSAPVEVRNDKTGKWRLCRLSSPAKFEDYAISYWRTYMNDDEIHFIIDYTNKTTNCLQKAGDHLSLVVYEHIDKEELNADTLPSGIKLSEFQIYLDNGDIVKF